MVLTKINVVFIAFTRVFRPHVPRCKGQALILPLPPASTILCASSMHDRSLFGQMRPAERKALEALGFRPRRKRALHVLPYPEKMRTTHALDAAACTEAFSLTMHMEHLRLLRYSSWSYGWNLRHFNIDSRCGIGSNIVPIRCLMS